MATLPARVTDLLARFRQGDAAATEDLFRAVQAELRRLARQKLRGEKPGHTLQATDLVNEAYLRLRNQLGAEFQNRAHFLSVAARAMRNILVDYARRKKARKRVEGGQRITLAGADAAIEVDAEAVVAIHESLDRLAQRYPLHARLVELTYFGGLTREEAAAFLEIEPLEAKRLLTFARAALRRDLETRS